MRIRKPISALIFSFVALLCFSLLATYQVLGQEESLSSGGMIISPVLIEREAEPGDVLSLSIKVNNREGDKEDALYPFATDFVPDPNEGGSPQFSKSSVPGSFSSWFSFPLEQVYVAIGESKEISFKIAVPQDADPGTHFGAVILSREVPEVEGESSSIGATYEVGTIVLIKVAGEVFEEGSFISFATTRRWYESPPVTFEARFENTGNVHLQPTGVIEIFNMAGVKEGTMQMNSNFGRVLPSSIRRFDERWNPGKWFGLIPRMGRYTATALMIHGSPSISTSLGPISFWLIPWKLLLALVGILVLGASVFMAFLRLYGRSVVSRHERKRSRK